MTIKRCFDPVVDDNTRLLILGSLPGEKSLAQSQYYAHPQNAFWRLLGEVVGVELVAQSYPDRLQTLRKHGVGLWDVVAQATRAGSLDSNIRDHAANDLAALVQTLPQLVAVAFNGGTAEKIGTRQLAAVGARYSLIQLPSSSPAHTLAYSQKREQWVMRLQNVLEDTHP